MKTTKFVISSLQFSIFTSAVLFAKAKILEKLMSDFSDVFNGDTVSIPVPSDAPKEIPSIILYSEDKKMKLEVAENRVNFFKYQRDDSEIVDPQKMIKLFLEILKVYKTVTQAVIGRLAVVTVKFMKIKEPALELAKHFCREEWIEEPFNRPENFEIHSHKKYSLCAFSVNSWVRCKTGRLTQDKEPIVLVTQDINTLVEELDKKDFKVEDVKKFLDMFIKEQEKIIYKYFPRK